jgi:NAD(P)-dependent dehydrogenase (short-subunit alcohol dehydrogenase family)
MAREATTTDKVAVVTGGGRGIGKATARAFAAAGMRVAIADLDGDVAAQAAAEIGGGALGAQLDVTDVAAFTAFLDRVEAEVGPLDVLVNNAGIMPIGPIDAETDVMTVRQLEINLHAVIHGTREAVRRMKPRGTGHILNVSSGGGKIAASHLATYTATKFGVVGFSEAVALELHGSGIQVSVVYPSVTRTDLASGLKDLRGVKSITPEQVADGILAAVRSPRFDVAIPRSLGMAIGLNKMLPFKVRAALARAIKADQIMVDYDRSARAAYVDRTTVAPTAPESAEEPAVRN